MSAVRSVVVVLLMSASALASAPALASCAPPVSVEEFAQRADAVVYGRVTGFQDGAPFGPPGRLATFSVERVLKGSAGASIVVAIGPEVGGGPGVVGATSVDYNMAAGPDHTLYLRGQGSGRFETDACSGSHGGAPTPEEEAFFGPGRAPQPGNAAGPSDLERGLIALAAVSAVAAGAAVLLYVRRTRPGATTSS